MRKLNNPMPAGGAPFNNEDLNDVFQTEFWDIIQARLNQYTTDAEGVIISGCVVTANASNFDMTAGIVYLNGEFMRIDAVTNQTFTKYIVASTPTNVGRVFNDASSKTMIIEKKASLSASVDAGGQEITISSIGSSLARRYGTLLWDGKIETFCIEPATGAVTYFDSAITLATGEAMMGEFEVIGVQLSGGAGAGHIGFAKKFLALRNFGGTVTLSQEEIVVAGITDSGCPTYTASVVSGKLRVQGTTGSGTTHRVIGRIRWFSTKF